MGLIQHHAVLATTWSEDEVSRIRKWVDEIALRGVGGYDPRSRFLFGDRQINGFVTVVLAPDGSNEGWDDSDFGDTIRYEFIQAIRLAEYDDGSSPWDWIEVGYGEAGFGVERRR